MTTPISRRRFLGTLVGLTVAPFIAARALVAAKPAPFIPLDLVYDTKEADRLSAAWRDDYGCPRSILVPSNRTPFQAYRNADGSITWGYLYIGDWDGTLKLEAGCTNPAWVLVDLLGETYQGTSDLVAAVASRSLVDKQALYDFGVWCDELVMDPESYSGGGPAYATPFWAPRHTIHTLHITEGNLRRSLETHFEVWKATNPRYRRSWPGIPYPGGAS